MTGFYESTVPQDFFKSIDTDSDGRVSFTEAKEYIIQNRPTNANIDEELLKLDTNNDGFLSLNEIDGY
jgi:Ca2+-binding EF-hand superfamily protein